MFLDDGHPTAIFHPCGGVRVSGISVTELTTTSASNSDPGLGWGIANVGSREGHSVAQIRLLATPPGWELQTTKPGTLLTAFSVDRTYIVAADTADPTAGNDSSVAFTLRDLRSLTDGEVWAVPKPFAQPQAMTRDEFRRHAAASC
ncbi:hypothetical protein [Micromonospora sp. AKA38]|uniref:hypothetical protein n=1 Tax=Micromonospora sp. AKA38 TaxID=2733861 RepID=UPI00248FDC69|nr:hypothetical protein [Micromonospora sp. AKA38]